MKVMPALTETAAACVGILQSIAWGVCRVSGCSVVVCTRGTALVNAPPCKILGGIKWASTP